MSLSAKLIFHTDSVSFGGSESDLIKLVASLKDKFAISFHISENCSHQLREFINAGHFECMVTPHYGNGLRAIAKGIRTAFKTIKQSQHAIHIVWSHHLDSNRWLQVVLALKRAKFLIVERSAPEKNMRFEKSKLTPIIKRIVSKVALQNVICGYSQKENYYKLFQAPRISVIPNSRNIKVIQQVANDYRNKDVRTGDAFRICVIGRLSPEKNPNEVLCAARILKDDIKLSINFIGDGELSDEMKSNIEEWGLMESVNMIGFDPDPIKWLATSDLFILSSLFEGLPGVLIEAMAAGVPCIATDVLGSNELVINNYSGLLVPVKNASGLATAIETMAKSYDLRNQFIRNAFNLVSEKYDAAIEEEKWLNLFQTIK